MLKEAALYQYVFLATHVETAAGGLRRTDPARLNEIVGAAVRHPYTWLGQPLPDGEAAVALPPAGQRRTVVRLYPPPDERSRWTRQERWGAYAEAYLHDDSLSLRLVYGCRGQADAETYRRLAEAPWTLPDEDFVQGHTLCFAGRVSDIAEAQSEAARVLSEDPTHQWPLRRADLPLGDGHAAWIFDRPGLPDRMALFYPDDDGAEMRMAVYLNTALPELLLSLHKVGHLYARGYEQALRALLVEREQALARVLAVGLPPSVSVNELDTRLAELANAYNAFARHLAIFDRLAQAVRVNLLNLRQCFAEHSLPREGPLGVCLTAAERAARQMEADEGFYRARMRQAQTTLSALQVRTEIERARLQEEEGRRTTWRNLLLAFIAAVLTLGQVMSDKVAEEFLSWSSTRLGQSVPAQWPAVWVFVTKLALVWAIGLSLLGLYSLVPRLFRKRQRSRISEPVHQALG